MATKKAKTARVEIELPDGTKISARGPMAEQMARRLMDTQWHYYWPPSYTASPVAPLTWSSNELNVATSLLTVDGNEAPPTAVTEAVKSAFAAAPV